MNYITIQNPWKSPKTPNKDYRVPEKPVFSYKGYFVYKNHPTSYVYAYNGIAFTERVGWDKQILIDFADRNTPDEKDPYYWPYLRAIKQIDINNQL